jgi:hypothetical protein
VTAWALRLFRDRLTASESRPLPALNRVLYAVVGDVIIAAGETTVRLATDSAWHGAERCRLTAGAAGATLLRWELGSGAVAPGSVPVLEQAMDLAAGARWLMRCDRVDFDPGGVALPHRHRGGGIRYLVAGALEVTVGDGAPRAVRPGGAWYESGREPVLARASATEPTSFIRVSILPAEIRGQSSIVYVDPADAGRGKPRRYTVWVDAPIELG